MRRITPIVLSFLIVACQQAPSQQDPHAMHEHMDHMHHEGIELTGDVLPSVDLLVHDDPKSGWNIELVTENFRFAPENASLDHIEGEGHAHLYINDEKIGRLYSNWHHIASLDAGTHTVRVNLNANNHSPFLVNGEEIDASVEITVE